MKYLASKYMEKVSWIKVERFRVINFCIDSVKIERFLFLIETLSFARNN